MIKPSIFTQSTFTEEIMYVNIETKVISDELDSSLRKMFALCGVHIPDSIEVLVEHDSFNDLIFSGELMDELSKHDDSDVFEYMDRWIRMKQNSINKEMIDGFDALQHLSVDLIAAIHTTDSFTSIMMTDTIDRETVLYRLTTEQLRENTWLIEQNYQILGSPPTNWKVVIDAKDDANVAMIMKGYTALASVRYVSMNTFRKDFPNISNYFHMDEAVKNTNAHPNSVGYISI